MNFFTDSILYFSGLLPASHEGWSVVECNLFRTRTAKKSLVCCIENVVDMVGGRRRIDVQLYDAAREVDIKSEMLTAMLCWKLEEERRRKES